MWQINPGSQHLINKFPERTACIKGKLSNNSFDYPDLKDVSQLQ